MILTFGVLVAMIDSTVVLFVPVPPQLNSRILLHGYVSLNQNYSSIESMVVDLAPDHPS